MLGKALIHRHKAAARAALYLLPVALFASAWGFIQAAGRFGWKPSWRGVDHSEIEAVRLLQEYLRFDTSYPDGNEIPGAEFLARQLEAAGIPARVERLGRRNANLWAVLEGEDPRALVLHNHLDVVAPRPSEQWRHPPFGGVLEPPFIYGRGAFDMKSYAIAQLMAMLEIARSGRVPRRSLIFLATGEEEIDSRLGAAWVLRQHPELVERFAAVLTEGGAVEAVSLEAVKYWGTEFGQKRYVDVWVCDHDRERLEALRRSLLAVEPELRPASPEVAEFFRHYGPSRASRLIRRLLGRPEALHDDPAARNLPPYLRAMLRNELEAFPVEEDPEGGFRMLVILHLLPDADFEEAWDELLPDGLHGFSLSIDLQHEPSPPSPLDHEVYRIIDEYMAETLPEVEHGPLFLPWSASDARFFRLAGIPSYGFTPFWILSSDAATMKGANERIAAPAFVAGVELYAGLVERLVER